MYKIRLSSADQSIAATLVTVALSGGFAPYGTTSLGPGTHQIQVRYNRDTGFNSSSNSFDPVRHGKLVREPTSLCATSAANTPGVPSLQTRAGIHPAGGL